MHAVIIIPYFYPKVGGLEKYALEIATGLARDFDWRITIITSNHLGRTDVRETVKGLSVIRLGTHVRLSNTPVGFDWYFKLSALLNELKPDVVNAHTPVPIISDLGIMAARKLHLPVVLTYQNDLYKDNLIFSGVSALYYHTLGNQSLAQANQIIVTSANYAQNSQKLQPLLSKISVVPPGIHLAKLQTKRQTQRPYVLFVGQLDTTHRHKGLDYLLHAMALLRTEHPELNLKIIGRGDDIARYQALAQQLGISQQVQFLGFVPDTELATYYAQALCFCLPSITKSEGFGMVILEAAAQKTPAIGSAIGGIPGVILADQTGLLVPPKNALALAEAIRQLLENPALTKQLGTAAYRRVIKDFIWPQQIKKTHQVFLQQL